MTADITAPTADELRDLARRTSFVVFDLDGTLSNIDHRLHYIQRPPSEKDWAAFFAACENDLPIGPMIRVA